MRHNFTAKTKRLALERSGQLCEAVGVVYGLEPGTRCTRAIGRGTVDFDHFPLPAHAEDSDGLENCVACCRQCHKYKTATYDIPAEAKIKRRRQKAGLDPIRRKPRPKIPIRKAEWPKRPFPKREKLP